MILESSNVVKCLQSTSIVERNYCTLKGDGDAPTYPSKCGEAIL